MSTQLEQISGKLFRRKPGQLGQPAYCYETCTSTNSVALELARNGAPAGTVVIAESQSAGRGRFNREWMTGAGDVAMSLVLRPDLPFHLAHRLTVFAAVAVFNMCTALGVQVQIKWPNDILLENSTKLAGILLETSSASGKIDLAVIGVGLNLTRSELAPPGAGYLSDVGCHIQLPEAISALLDALAKNLPALADEKLFEKTLRTFREHNVTLGKRVILQQGNQTICGVAEEILADGALLVRQIDGSTVRAVAGEVTIVR